jgi:hypothetical protein
VVSNWLLTLSASPTVQSTEFARISTAFGLHDADGTDFATIQGVDYTSATPRMYADAWCVTGAHLSVKTKAAFDTAQCYPTSLVFCAGPNARAPPQQGPRASSMRRTFSAQAHADMAFLVAGAAWAVYAALHASAACGCDAVLIPFVSGGLYAGPHDRDVLRSLFVENIEAMLRGGYGHGPPLGWYFREVHVVFLPRSSKPSDGSASLKLGNRGHGLRDNLANLRDTYNLMYALEIWTATDERNLNLAVESAKVSKLVPSRTARHSVMPRYKCHRRPVGACETEWAGACDHVCACRSAVRQTASGPLRA